MTRGKYYVSVEIDFEKAWNDSSEEEQHQILADNIGLLTDDELINEAQYRDLI